MNPQELEIAAILLHAAIDAITAAIRAGQSKDQILIKIKHIEEEAVQIDKDVDVILDGG